MLLKFGLIETSKQHQHLIYNTLNSLIIKKPFKNSVTSLLHFERPENNEKLL